jgi:hypothetical protein
MAIVCRAVAGLRRHPDSASELLTQELLGHPVRVHSTRGGFARCSLRDGYTGWMPVSSLTPDGRYPATHFVKKRFARIRGKAIGPILVPMGCLVKVETIGRARHVVVLPDGRHGTVAAGALGEIGEDDFGLSDLPVILEQVKGTPYIWGGKSTFGFDCSGLVQFVFGLLGIALPRDSGDQAKMGRLARDINRLRIYDLIFFGTGDGIDHVALHLGGLDMIHASGYVRVESLKPSSPGFRSDLHQKYRFARRISNVQG